MMQPMHDPPPLAGPGFAGIREGSFVRRAVYVCRADICLNCGRCRTACAANAIFTYRGRPVIDPCLCSDCGRCQKSCPTGAILRTVQLTTE